MELKYEKINELDENQFKTLLEFIGFDELKQKLIDNAGSFPKTSPYYAGAKLTGTFWSGFRKEKIPNSRVSRFYIDEVFKNKSKLNVEFFKELIENKVKEFDEFSSTTIMKFDEKLQSVICILYDIEISADIQKYMNEIKKITSNYEEKINKNNEEFERKLKLVEDEKIKQKEQYENIMKDLRKEVFKEKENNENSKINLINNIIHNSKYINLSVEINELNLENKEMLIAYLNKSFLENLKLLEIKQYEELAKELTLQYILVEIMEDNFNE